MRLPAVLSKNSLQCIGSSSRPCGGLLVHSWARARRNAGYTTRGRHQPGYGGQCSVRSSDITDSWVRSTKTFQESSVDCNSQFDVLGLAQAMLDFSASVDDSFLESVAVTKGERRVINLSERTELLQTLENNSYTVSAGGSLSNTLQALARLGESEHKLFDGERLRVGMAGSIGGDNLGEYYCAQLNAAGVHVFTDGQTDVHTGTVAVLTTPDAQRSMLSYLGEPTPLQLTSSVLSAIKQTRVLLIEGYLWELPGAASVIRQAIQVAIEHGAMVAMTAGDAGVINRHRQEVLDAIDAGVSILFANFSEAVALVGKPDATAEEAALQLGSTCSLVAVTDGANGSLITALGSLYVIPPFWNSKPPVDTCGAGDGYAAGLLYGLLSGCCVTNMGKLAARTASTVISKHGAVLCMEEAEKLVAQLPPLVRRSTNTEGNTASPIVESL